MRRLILRSFQSPCDIVMLTAAVRDLHAAFPGQFETVAINSDESVRHLKGPGRPAIDQAARAAMLGGLECVDHVLIFDDATPHRLLEVIRPDILVKGGTTTEIVGREVVEQYDGRVEQTAEIPGLSTTALLSRLQSLPTAALSRANDPSESFVTEN